MALPSANVPLHRSLNYFKSTKVAASGLKDILSSPNSPYLLAVLKNMKASVYSNSIKLQNHRKIDFLIDNIAEKAASHDHVLEKLQQREK